MGATTDIALNGDKQPYFWIYQFVGDDMKATLVAETSEKNTVIKSIHIQHLYVKDHSLVNINTMCAQYLSLG